MVTLVDCFRYRFSSGWRYGWHRFICGDIEIGSVRNVSIEFHCCRKLNGTSVYRLDNEDFIKHTKYCVIHECLKLNHINICNAWNVTCCALAACRAVFWLCALFCLWMSHVFFLSAIWFRYLIFTYQFIVNYTHAMVVSNLGHSFWILNSVCCRGPALYKVYVTKQNNLQGCRWFS